MSYAEFVEWAAYYEVEPFGGARADIHAAQICAVLGEVNRNRRKRRKAFAVADFLIDWWGDRKRRRDGPEQAQALLDKFRGLAEAMGLETEPETEPETSDNV